MSSPRLQSPLMTRHRMAWGLGISGLVPFIACLLLAFLGPTVWQVSAVYAFLYYSAVILSFLGGAHWGAVMQRADGERVTGDVRRLALAMLPSLMAWPALMLSPVIGLWVLMIGFVLVWIYDLSREGRFGWPAWYLLLRSVLTVVVVIAHAGMVLRLGESAWG